MELLSQAMTSASSEEATLDDRLDAAREFPFKADQWTQSAVTSFERRDGGRIKCLTAEDLFLEGMRKGYRRGLEESELMLESCVTAVARKRWKPVATSPKAPLRN